MAKFSYENMLVKEQQKAQNGGNNNFGDKPKVIFLSKLLADDGDSVVVRLPYESHKDFDFANVHRVALKSGGYKNISCLREDYDSVDKCPLCASGQTPKGRFFLKGVTYIQDDNGIQVVPFVWERAAGFAKEINGYIEEFGSLKNFPLKIKRNGKKGDQQTTYSIIPANASIYNTQTYPADFSGIETLDISKFAYVERNFNDLSTLVLTGDLPPKEVKEQSQATSSHLQTVNTNVGGNVADTFAPDVTSAENNPFVTQEKQVLQPNTSPRTVPSQQPQQTSQEGTYRPRRTTY